MKVIFLDIDGVLNSNDYLNSLHFNYRSKVQKGLKNFPIEEGFLDDKYGSFFDPRCINFLDSIINYTGAKIVISSTWRKDGLLKMKNLWKDRNLPGEIISITPILNRKRGEEINNYLEKHDYVENYLILDDDSDMLLKQQLNFVKTNSRFGITYFDAEESIKILNKKR